MQKIIIVCGHYGCGKTNLSLNLAIEAAQKGQPVTLIDMDVVNPYFRSSEYGELLEKYGVRLIAPVYANSSLDMLYVVNRYRPLSTEAEETVELLAEIESASRLKATGVVNNSHLKQETDEQVILSAVPYGREAAEKLGLPLCFTTAPKGLTEALAGKVENLHPVEVYVHSPWE